MQKFDIRDFVVTNRPAKGVSVVFNPIEGSLMPYRQYRVAFNKFLRGLSKVYRESILPALMDYRRFNRDSVDIEVVDDEGWFIALEQQANGLEFALTSSVAAIYRLELDRHTMAWMREAQAALSVDLRAVVKNEDLDQYLRDAATRNAGLIKSLKGDVVSDIRRLVIDAKLSGIPAKQLTAQIRERFKVATTRAELIATDQLNKLTSDLNRIRQQQAGIDEYSWQDSRDERVRPRHRALRNKRYKWGEPTGAEGGLPPGQPVRCRCSARAVVTF